MMVAVGIKFKETNLAAITSGSNIQATCTPNIAKTPIMPRIKNLGDFNFVLVASLKLFFFLRNEPVKSIAAPRGHIHPQKNLPKKTVTNSIKAESIMPGNKILSLREVKIMIRGFVLKNASGGTAPFSG
jgi:hypothetical protein